MPPDSVRMPTSRLLARPAKSSSSRNALLEHGARQAEVAAVDQQVLAHREVGIEVVHLRHDADADARLARRLGHRLADHLDAAAVRVDEAEAAAQRRRLAGAVGTEQPEAVAAADRRSSGRARLRCRRSACAVRRRAGRRRRGAVPAVGGRPCACRRASVTSLPHAGDHALQLRQAAVEEMAAAGKHDDRQLLRPRPREHVGERHDVVLLAVDHDRVGGHVLRRRSGAPRARPARAAAPSRACATRVCTNEPNENPASTTRQRRRRTLACA